ncbi:RagB/SusD family nutrient uptake outer membrane protein [Cellulophaga sp. F20128]|uniref:RagB/SusD family nutrient uptake outer membrane protein n=1 Tax=Cellulophaga sp. F20128 TaxID=2926413 RepID=UPI001FF6B01B|nr:RagB/SusD family nutrient uptake outer membrane protein [Cellulophaga sp. F20128]MCK0158251.1 RagB/SusD family nutrient uptake outer membrane protein [Cellulophaga sp. F20128]
MKTYIKLILGLSLILTSCTKDVIEVASSTNISSETFWKTETDARLALNGIYNSLAGLEQNYIYYDVMSDNAYNNYPWEGYKAIADGTHDARGPGVIGWIWSSCFQGIGRANVLLDNVDNVEGLDEDFKNSAIGEALFLRAYFYFKLSDFYGGVPIITESPKIEHSELPRDTKEAVINQIIDDLDQAYNHLPITQTEVGKATKGAARALKARVELYNERWEDAAISAQEVLGMGYTLFPEYRDLFRQANENNEEVIFDVQYISPEQGNLIELYLGSYTVGGWSSVVPLQNMIDEYEMIDGMSISDSPLYDPENPYDNRDPRLKQTISVPGATINGIVDHVGEFGGYCFKKYTEYDEIGVVSPTPYPTETGQNVIILRLASVLLTYAEAQNEAVGPDASVYDAINEIRARPSVNMPPLPLGLSKSQMREAIRHERRVELLLEGTRYSDIRRWGIAEQVMDGLTDPGGIRSFNPDRDYLFPIPAGEFDIEGTALEQNPNY